MGLLYLFALILSPSRSHYRHAISSMYYVLQARVCIPALVVWHSNNRIYSAQHNTVMYSLSSPPYFSTVTQTRQGFRENKLLNGKCVFRFSIQ
jgi:hypothetical protein